MKVYLSASNPSVRVPFREVTLSNHEQIRLYDTSGPYTDPEYTPDVKQGLPPLRRHWILSRNDVEPGAGGRWGLRAKPGQRVTQMHYARRGEITPEMEFVALREGMSPEFVRDEVARGRAIIPANINHPETEPMIIGRQLPGEDQRQHRQLRGLLLDRGGGREDDVGHPLGRRHHHGPLHRQEHPRDARVDPAQLAGAGGHGADLPGAREGQRQGRGPHLGGLPRHPDRAGRAGRRLLHDPRGRAAALHPAHREAPHRHRLARRLDHGQVVPGPPPGELPLHPLPRDLRDHGRLRRGLLAGRRAAPRLPRRRQRRRPVRRARHPGRADHRRVGARLPGDDRGPGPRAHAPDQGEHGPAARESATRRPSTPWGRSPPTSRPATTTSPPPSARP